MRRSQLSLVDGGILPMGGVDFVQPNGPTAMQARKPISALMFTFLTTTGI
jgi:hypothetical protein